MKILALFFLSILYSCSALVPVAVGRSPAENIAKNCPDLMSDFIFTPSYQKDLKTALLDKKLITFKQKLMQVEYPRLKWINDVKKSFNISLKNWNHKRFPTFYLAHEEEVIPIANAYSKSLEKELNNELDEQAIDNLKSVRSWMSSYENYNQELDQFLEERIALQYNYSLIQKLDLKNETRDIALTFKRQGVLTSEVFSLHPDDNTYKSLLGDLKNQIYELDGGLLNDGKIKERIVRQAMLQDMLTIVQRELEHDIKNKDTLPTDILRELNRVNNLMNNQDFKASTYGVFKITDKVFIAELISLSKMDKVYDIFKTPAIKLKSILGNFLDGKKSDKEKIGFFGRLYARIKNLTPKQLTVGTSVMATAGFGSYRYFWFDKSSNIELNANDPHMIQLEQTQKALKAESDGQSKAVEIQIDEEIVQ